MYRAGEMQVILMADIQMRFKSGRILCGPEVGILLGMTHGVRELYYDTWVTGLIGTHHPTLNYLGEIEEIGGLRGGLMGMGAQACCPRAPESPR